MPPDARSYFSRATGAVILTLAAKVNAAASSKCSPTSSCISTAPAPASHRLTQPRLVCSSLVPTYRPTPNNHLSFARRSFCMFHGLLSPRGNPKYLRATACRPFYVAFVQGLSLTRRIGTDASFNNRTDVRQNPLPTPHRYFLISTPCFHSGVRIVFPPVDVFVEFRLLCLR